MDVQLVDVFARPFESWRYRKATCEEMLSNTPVGSIPQLIVKESLITTITNHHEAACWIAKGIDFTKLGNHIDDVLNDSQEYRGWRKAMPSRTPKELSDYQLKYPPNDFGIVDKMITEYGLLLPEGQVLFHGGVWPSQSSFVTSRPLSTSLSPQVAFLNALHQGKAYDAGRLDLFVLRCCGCKSRAFVYKRGNTSQGHENEVVLSSGATLIIQNAEVIISNYEFEKDLSWKYPKKRGQIRVVGVDLR